eukprot:723275-Rhodomonas_salina.2
MWGSLAALSLSVTCACTLETGLRALPITEHCPLEEDLCEDHEAQVEPRRDVSRDDKPVLQHQRQTARLPRSTPAPLSSLFADVGRASISVTRDFEACRQHRKTARTQEEAENGRVEASAGGD